jgi:hypothetical protein
MPIFEDKPDADCQDLPAQVQTQPEHYKGVTVDESLVNRNSLTTYLEGQSWAVDYYSRVLNKNTSTSGLQLGLNATYQQYKLIRGFEFKVTSPLDSSQSDGSKEMSLTGTANVYSVLIPNEGDMFIADVGDGREGLFQITSSVRKTIYKETAHEVQYKMVSYNDHNTAKDLNEKVVETLYFNREYMREGLTPLIHSDTVATIRKLEEHNGRLIALYFSDFYSREHNTLILPNQKYPTYDPFLTKFITNLLTNREHPAVRNIKLFNVENDQAMYEMSVWNCLETLDNALLSMVAQEMGVVSVRHFFSQPMFNSIYYSRVNAVVYPLQYQTNVDAGYKEIAPKLSSRFKEGARRFRELKRTLQETHLIMDTADGPFVPTEGDPVKEIYSVTADDYYVFTKEFYNYDAIVGNLSELENMVRTALRREPIDVVSLEKLCTSALKWDNLDRFYFVPVLLLMLRIYQRGL